MWDDLKGLQASIAEAVETSFDWASESKGGAITSGQVAEVVMQVVRPTLTMHVNDSISLTMERGLRLDAEATRTAAQESATAAVMARRGATLSLAALIRLVDQALATLPEGVDLEVWTEMQVLQALARRLKREATG